VFLCTSTSQFFLNEILNEVAGKCKILCALHQMLCRDIIKKDEMGETCRKDGGIRNAYSNLFYLQELEVIENLHLSRVDWVKPAQNIIQ
jgi:hypothetical protein